MILLLTIEKVYKINGHGLWRASYVLGLVYSISRVGKIPSDASVRRPLRNEIRNINIKPKPVKIICLIIHICKIKIESNRLI